ncbi:MAG: tyrosine-type recombinase/integrase [Bifidobacteriaceae bacterium]|nr:tyrosine-type recombinase/integrase [Bifidobacteriaceae bacterium]
MYDQARAQVGRPALRFYDLRHTAGTMFAQHGATLKEIMDAGGWADVNVAMSYQHATSERKTALAGNGRDPHAPRKHRRQQSQKRIPTRTHSQASSSLWSHRPSQMLLRR